MFYLHHLTVESSVLSSTLYTSEKLSPLHILNPQNNPNSSLHKNVIPVPQTIKYMYSKGQPVSFRENRCLLCDPQRIHKYTVWAEHRNLNDKPGGAYSYHYALEL